MPLIRKDQFDAAVNAALNQIQVDSGDMVCSVDQVADWSDIVLEGKDSFAKAISRAFAEAGISVDE